MDKDKIVKVRAAHKPKPNLERVAHSIPEVEQPDQLAPTQQLESLAEPIKSESLYGSGWSLAELMNEFGGR